MKNKKIIFAVVSIILIFLAIGIILNISTRKNRIADKEEVLVKGMSEGTQVTELQGQLTNLEKEKEDYATKVQSFKSAIATAITSAGVSTSGDASTETMAENIGKIVSSSTSATATSSDILSGKTAWVNGKKVTGTIENFGSGWVWPNASNNGKYQLEEYTFSSGSKTEAIALYTRPGYMTGNAKVIVTDSMITELKGITASQIAKGQKVLGISGTYTSDATAAAGNILSGKTAYVNGSKLTGTMANKGTLNWSPTSSTTKTVEAGYYSGGTLDSSGAYDAGYEAGYNAGYSGGASASKIEWVTSNHNITKSNRWEGLTINIGTGWDYVYWAFNNVTYSGNNYGDLTERFNSASYNKDTGVVTLQTFSPSVSAVNIVIIRCRLVQE